MSRASNPVKCPSCGGMLHPVKYVCSNCETEVSGDFPACPFCTLDEENRNLLELFLAARGNLKSVERMLGLSYPTVRARVEEMFNALEERMAGDESRIELLESLHRGEISVQDALESIGIQKGRQL
jgi:hypothetical protein